MITARAPAPLLVALWLGCAGPARPPGVNDMPPELETLSAYPAGSDPVYGELAEREVASFEAFERAEQAYAAGRYLEAARGFMAAAKTLEDRPDQPLRDLFAANRRVCYANADRAYRQAAAVAEARAALRAAASEDSLNTRAIEELLSRLPP